MPQIQIIDNPQANSMRDAASGLSALTQANEALRARRAMRWQMLKDLPPAARRSAMKAFAEDEMNVDTDVMPSAPSAPQPSEQAAPSGGGLKAIEQSTPKETSLLGKLGALFAPTPDPAENPTYDENRVSKQTLARLSGDNPALGRSISEAEAQDIIKRGGKEMNYGGVMTTFENGSTDPKYTFGGREATDEMVNTMADEAGSAEMQANSSDNNAANKNRDATFNRLMSGKGISPEEEQKLFNFGISKFGNNAFAEPNLKKTIWAYANFITPAGTPAGYKMTEGQKAPGPEIYDDSVPTQVAQQGQPAQGGAPAPRLVAGESQSTAASRGSSFKGAQGSQFGPQGAVSDEDVANIDFLANDWAGAQTGYSKAMLYAKRIKDPAASAAAMQYVNSMFENRMGSYDDGVSKEMVQMSEREATKQSSGGGRGVYTDGLGENGWLPINGGWQQVFRPHTGDPDVDALGTLLSVKFKDRRQVIVNAMKTVQMAEQGNPAAKALLATARSKLGTSLSQAKLYPESVANKNALGDGTKGYMVDDGTLNNMASVYEAEQIPEDLDDTSFFGLFGKKYKKGQYADKESMAGYMKARQGNSTEQPSARKKVSGI